VPPNQSVKSYVGPHIDAGVTLPEEALKQPVGPRLYEAVPANLVLRPLPGRRGLPRSRTSSGWLLWSSAGIGSAQERRTSAVPLARLTTHDPGTSASILVHREHSRASCGVFTMGSFWLRCIANDGEAALSREGGDQVPVTTVLGLQDGLEGARLRLGARRLPTPADSRSAAAMSG
jgi:hypothetical protein